MDDPKRLRELAEWYRDWAKVGNQEDRAFRLRHADSLERRAAEIEDLQKRAESKT